MVQRSDSGVGLVALQENVTLYMGQLFLWSLVTHVIACVVVPILVSTSPLMSCK